MEYRKVIPSTSRFGKLYHQRHVLFTFGFDDFKLTTLGNLTDYVFYINVTKGTKLKDASDQQSFNRNVEDLEVWLAEIEGQLMSEDYGKVRNRISRFHHALSAFIEQGNLNSVI